MTPTKEQVNEFVDYVFSFYGKGGIYDINANRQTVRWAVNRYLKRTSDFCGDSIDRENVRTILTHEYGLTPVRKNL